MITAIDAKRTQDDRIIVQYTYTRYPKWGQTLIAYAIGAGGENRKIPAVLLVEPSREKPMVSETAQARPTMLTPAIRSISTEGELDITQLVGPDTSQVLAMSCGLESARAQLIEIKPDAATVRPTVTPISADDFFSPGMRRFCKID